MTTFCAFYGPLTVCESLYEIKVVSQYYNKNMFRGWANDIEKKNKEGNRQDVAVVN